ncbi:cytochrome P450 [Dactylonectria estremocensis]|uniref:Cytochrome P450 n=1 Tax=Dactylonectria estremocensis TaxID=1079267 RepID=A0A9P9IXT4_9HYPO|nr:cytochrome P450 [Dactylonectria estremocensis]
MAEAQVLVGEAGAVNESANGFLSVLTKDRAGMATNSAIAVVAGIVFLFLISSIFATPKLDALEPPLLKPSIPFLGHLINLLQHQAKYHVILGRKTGKPIATLPMLNGKMYAVWEPALIASGLRSKNLSTTPQALAGTQSLCQLRDETLAIFSGPGKTAQVAEHMLLHIIPMSLAGAHLQKINQVAVAKLAVDLSRLQSESVPNLWLWFRRMLTLPTTKAMYGDEDPFAKDLDLENVLWTFEANLPKLIANVYPSITAPTGHRARATLGEVLGRYYAARHDSSPSASEFVRARAQYFRDYDITDDEIARIEIILPFTAMVNTVPALFWLFCFVFSRPTLLARLREEVELLTTRDGDEVTIPLKLLEERAPLLSSCYKETLRLTVHQVSTRTVIEDTTLSDGKGNSYLLRKDNVIQMSLAASHWTEQFWGSDVNDFNPERFLNRKTDDGPGSQKAIRAAFLPYGGGQHYCPGKGFAYAEMMAAMTTLLLGFDVEPHGGEWKVPDWATWSIVDAVTKPKGKGEGFGIEVKRREGWEGVEWKYDV